MVTALMRHNPHYFIGIDFARLRLLITCMDICTSLSTMRMNSSHANSFILRIVDRPSSSVIALWAFILSGHSVKNRAIYSRSATSLYTTKYNQRRSIVVPHELLDGSRIPAKPCSQLSIDLISILSSAN